MKLEQIVGFLIVTFLIAGLVALILDSAFPKLFNIFGMNKKGPLDESPEEAHKKYVRRRHDSWIKDLIDDSETKK